MEALTDYMNELGEALEDIETGNFEAETRAVRRSESSSDEKNSEDEAHAEAESFFEGLPAAEADDSVEFGIKTKFTTYRRRPNAAVSGR